MQNNQVKHLKF